MRQAANKNRNKKSSNKRTCNESHAFRVKNLFEKLQAQMCVTGQLRKLPSSSQVGFECHKDGGSNQLKVKTSRRESGRAHFTN